MRLKLQGVVIGDAFGLVQHRIHVVAGIGHADRRVARVFDWSKSVQLGRYSGLTPP